MASIYLDDYFILFVLVIWAKSASLPHSIKPLRLPEGTRDQGYFSGTALSGEMTMEYFCRTIASEFWICLDLLLLFSSFSAE